MRLEPCPTTSVEWGQRWRDWLASLYRYIVYVDTYRIRGGSVTLAVAPATTTTVTENACLTTSIISLAATNAAAAAELGGTAMFVSTKSDGSFVVTHASSAGSRTFDYIIVNE